jgi:hypothetical protein
VRCRRQADTFEAAEGGHALHVMQAPDEARGSVGGGWAAMWGQEETRAHFDRDSGRWTGEY